MKRRRWVVVSCASVLLGTLAAKDALDRCGTTFGRTQQEVFLHQRNIVEQARARVAAKALGQGAEAAAAPVINQNLGQIAIIDDSGGVIGRRNLFNLDRRTVAFVPVKGGYQVELGGDTFDTAASDNGSMLAGLGDDDTRAVALPFAFPFFGANYQQVWVNSNGTLTFTAGDTEYNGLYGHFVAAFPAIAACFTDLDPSAPASGGVRVLTENGRVVVTWAAVPLAGTPAQIENFQMRLYPTGRIETAYRSTKPPAALVGITPGSFQQVDLVDFASGPANVFPGGVAETFSSNDSLDVIYAAQRFYQTHEDAYDYLVFYNAEGIPADQGVVAYEITTRSSGEGYGDTPTDIGKELGSPRRLQAVLNMGPLSQYPAGSTSPVPARGTVGDTPLSLLGHETGHLFLAFVSVPDPGNPGALPMLGRALAHWAFTFDSEASFLEGNRIADRGADLSPRFETTGTVEGYAPLDQYLMGFRAPEEVPPVFVVLNSGQSTTRPPQTGIRFNGSRVDVGVNDIVRVAGRRTPDWTVAQRKFRSAFVLIVPAGSDLSAGSVVSSNVAQLDRYRSDFEAFYAHAADNRAAIDTNLRRSVTLSLAPAAGVVEGAESTASIEIARAAAAPVTFTLRRPNGVLTAPASVTIPAGASRATFSVFGVRTGVEELSAEPSDASYETTFARVQVNAVSNLRVSLVGSDPLLVRVTDQNKLPYAGVRVNGVASGQDGRAAVSWPAGAASVSVAIDGAAPAPAITSVVNGASFQPRLGIGAFATIFGERLAGAQLKINGAAVTVLFASDKQVNFLAPANLSPGAAQVSIETSLGVAVARVQFETYAPGILGGGIDGGAIVLYCTGVGSGLEVQLDGASLPFTLSASNVPGLSIVSAAVPAGAQPGPHNLTLSLNGIVSNTVQIQIGTGP